MILAGDSNNNFLNFDAYKKFKIWYSLRFVFR